MNAYAGEERMSSNVDVRALRPAGAVTSIRSFLSEYFSVETIEREPRPGVLRILDDRSPRNRVLVDVHAAEAAPPYRIIEGIRALAPVELAGQRAIAVTARPGEEKSLTDQVDLHRLVTAFPSLEVEPSAVTERLRGSFASNVRIARWIEIARQRLACDEEGDDKLDWEPSFLGPRRGVPVGFERRATLLRPDPSAHTIRRVGCAHSIATVAMRTTEPNARRPTGAR